jgi:pimeloyl-ACP methyl ester carboxylesterase
MPDTPSRFIDSPDGTRLAVFSEGSGPPLLLVHGTSADHTTFRVVGPMFARTWTVHAMDRRGRGASGDPATYSIEREYEDVAAVVDAIAAEGGSDVAVVGHSFGGRVALGAAVQTRRIASVVAYESAPSLPDDPYQSRGLRDRLAAILREDGPAALYETFLREIIGMSDDDIAAYRSNPVWPARVAAAPTILRELEAEASAAAGLDVLERVAVPVLQVLGGDSRAAFRGAVAELDARLPISRMAVIDGAKHAAHHTHPDQFVGAVNAFLGGSGDLRGTLRTGGPLNHDR